MGTLRFPKVFNETLALTVVLSIVPPVNTNLRMKFLRLAYEFPLYSPFTVYDCTLKLPGFCVGPLDLEQEKYKNAIAAMKIFFTWNH